MREKLIELLGGDMCKDCYCEDCEYEHDEKSCIEHIKRKMADHLIANGVTLDNQVSSSKWIPVTERLPEKMGQCVCRYVFGENAEYPFFQVLWYFANTEKPHFQHEGSMGLRVTHWMPLPEPPKENDND